LVVRQGFLSLRKLRAAQDTLLCSIAGHMINQTTSDMEAADSSGSLPEIIHRSRSSDAADAKTSRFVVGGDGAAKTVPRRSMEDAAAPAEAQMKPPLQSRVTTNKEGTPAPKKSKKQRPPSRKAVCRNLRMCGSARVPKVTRSPHKLSAAERIELDASGAANAVRKAYEAARLARAERIRGYAKNLPGVFQKQGLAMIRSTRGKRFFSARGSGIWLIARGLHEPVRHYNGFGGALGAEGLKLPSFKVECVRYFDIGCVDMTEKQKAQRQTQISQLGIDMRPVLIAG
jgi:hypothetical protein